MAQIGRPPYPTLDRGLWDEFRIADQEDFSNLGTYNPASRLPSGAPSDHARYPALAFDAGFSPAIGWGNQQARRFFNQMVGREGIHYVILGDHIWSRERGLHPYTYGGHSNHVHVSGNAGGGDAGSPNPERTREARARVEFIARGAYRRGVDPGSVLSVVPGEGGFVKRPPGDSGTSYGPFQLHEGGALPREIDDPQTWAWSPAGMNYALDRIARVASGVRPGELSIERIITRFERPADPEANIADAMDVYERAGAAKALPPSPPRGGVEPIGFQWRPWKRRFWTQDLNEIPGYPGGSDPFKGGVAGALLPDSVGEFFHIILWPFVHPLRSAEILAGSFILIAGLVLLARALGAPIPVLPPVASAVKSVIPK